MSRLNSLNQRILSMEGLESRNLMTRFGVLPAVEPLPIETKSYEGQDYFVADSFSFGVEREMKESGEKGGTKDINIGVGELQDCTISKSMDHASADLAQYSINGNSCEAAGNKSGRLFIKSWSTSGDAYNRPAVDEVMSGDISIGVGELHDGVYQFHAPAAAGEKMVKTWSIAFENGRINRIAVVSDPDPTTPEYLELKIVADQWDFVHDTRG